MATRRLHVPLFTAFTPPAIAERMLGSRTRVVVCDLEQAPEARSRQCHVRSDAMADHPLPQLPRNLILEDPMDEYEMVRRVHVLPDQFAARLDESTNRGLRSMNAGGEWDELMDLLLAALIDNGTAVTPAEQEELRGLLEAMHMPTDQVQHLKVA